MISWNQEKFYHVKIESNNARTDEIHGINFTWEFLKERVLEPYSQGRSITLFGTTLTPNDIRRIRIVETSGEAQKSTIDNPYSNNLYAPGERDVTNGLITGPPGGESRFLSSYNEQLRPPKDTREVFVVHGRNSAARDALFEFLRAIDLHPLEWTEAIRSTGKTAPYIGEILDAAFSRAHAIIVLFTPDDEAQLKDRFQEEGDPPHETRLSGQARPNVIFEAGMAVGRSEYRTVLVEIGDLRPFSDIAGRHAVRINNSSARRQDLAMRLQNAGCPINLEGTDWHNIGDFEGVV